MVRIRSGEVIRLVGWCMSLVVLGGILVGATVSTENRTAEGTVFAAGIGYQVAPDSLVNVALLSGVTVVAPVRAEGVTTNAASTGSSSMSIRIGFEGLNRSRPTGDGDPPDVQVAAGPNHVIELVNRRVGIYSKQGSLLKDVSLRAFFGANETVRGVFDPWIVWDNLSRRWFASSAEDVPSTVTDPDGTPVARTWPAAVRVAVSATTDPLGIWTIYTVRDSTGDPDRPLVGFSDDKVMVTMNSVDRETGSFDGATYWILSKTPMLIGATTDVFRSEDEIFILTIAPVDAQSPGERAWMVGRWWILSNQVRVYDISGVPPAVTIRITDVRIGGFEEPPDAVQKGGPALIETNTGVYTAVADATLRNGRLWFVMNIGCKPTKDVLRACLRITELDVTNPSRITVVQQFNHFAKGKSYYYPALSTDAARNLVVVFGFASSVDYPSVAIARQLFGQPGSLQGQLTLREGTTPYVNSTPTPRFGDYFGASTDPVDSGVIWVAGEYNRTGRGTSTWSTYVGAVRVRDVAMTANPSSHRLTTGSNATSTISLASYGGFSGTVYLDTLVSPTGLTASLSASSISLSAGGSTSVVLSIRTTNATPSAVYTVTVRARSGNLVNTIDVPVAVETGGGGDGGSVASGTLITLADGRNVPVQALEVGDLVLGYDTDSGRFVTAVITAIEIVDTTDLLVIQTEAGAPFRVDANPRQTLWVRTIEGFVGWVSVTAVRPGDSLFTVDGWARVTSVEYAPFGQHAMYDVFATAPYFAAGYLDPPHKQ